MKKARNLEDEDLVKRILVTGDGSLFEIIYDRYADKVYSKCLDFSKNTELAQDWTHDIFVKVYLALNKFSFKSRLSTWIYSITYNFCVDELKKLNRRRATRENMEYDLTVAPFLEASDEQLLQIEVDRLKQILELIEPAERSLLFMKYQDDASISEIADTLSISESAVKMRLKRSRDTVVGIYKKKFEHNIF